MSFLIALQQVQLPTFYGQHEPIGRGGNQHNGDVGRMKSAILLRELRALSTPADPMTLSDLTGFTKSSINYCMELLIKAGAARRVPRLDNKVFWEAIREKTM